MQAIPMTLRGAEKLREELDYLSLCVVLKSLPLLLRPVNTAI